MAIAKDAEAWRVAEGPRKPFPDPVIRAFEAGAAAVRCEHYNEYCPVGSKVKKLPHFNHSRRTITPIFITLLM